jgi:hypothetical protein
MFADRAQLDADIAAAQAAGATGASGPPTVFDLIRSVGNVVFSGDHRNSFMAAVDLVEGPDPSAPPVVAPVPVVAATEPVQVASPPSVAYVPPFQAPTVAPDAPPAVIPVGSTLPPSVSIDPAQPVFVDPAQPVYPGAQPVQPVYPGPTPTY